MANSYFLTYNLESFTLHITMFYISSSQSKLLSLANNITLRHMIRSSKTRIIPLRSNIDRQKMIPSLNKIQRQGLIIHTYYGFKQC